MGKGKKKDKKKEEGTSSSTKATPTEDQPSHQQLEEAEEFVGITGPKKKQEKQKKKEPEIASQSTSQEKTEPENVPMDVDEPKKKVEPEEKPETLEVEFAGLGLGTKKKNPRKKKKVASGVETSQTFVKPTVPAPTTSTSTYHLQSQIPPEPQPSVSSVPVASAWAGGGGIGRGRGRGRGAPSSQIFPQAPPPTTTTRREPEPPLVSSWKTPIVPETRTVHDLGAHQGTAAVSVPPGFSSSAGVGIPTYLSSAASSSSGNGSSNGSSPARKVPSQVHQVKPRSRPSEDLSVTAYKIPSKIEGRGVPCKRITVLANYLRMKLEPLKIHRYDVTFKPDRPKKFLSQAFVIAKERCFKGHLIAFDQTKNCYVLTALPNVTGSERFATNVEIKDANGKIVKFEVSLKFTGIVDLGTITRYMETGGTSLSPPTEAIQCVDVVLRQGTLESYVKAGRQFFKRPRDPIDLGDGMEMWTGLFQSAIFTSQAFINIDVAHKGFPKQQSLLDLISRDFRLDLNRPIEMQRGRGSEVFQSFIKGVKVVASVGGQGGDKREFICNGIVDPPLKLFFSCVDSKGAPSKMSVAEYFSREKNYRIRYPNLNCMWVGPKEKNIFYPMELLHISYGQPMNRQLNENQLATMVREAATPPNIRKKKIEDVIKDMNYSDNVFFKKFGMTITNQFLTVDAKVLRPPRIELGGTTVEPKRGAWFANRLFKPMSLTSWGCIAVDIDQKGCLEELIRLIPRVASDMGMQVDSPKMLNFNVKINELQRVLYSTQDKKLQFLFVVLSGRGRDYYHKLKRMAEREIGVLTQCIKEYTVARKLNDQTVRNILLKVNSKLMGINHVLDESSVPQCLRGGKVMVVGADVTHPSPDQSSVPSIAAVTASIDPTHYKYNIALSIQTPKKEMIVDFEDMMVEHLNIYQKAHNDLPSRIYMFRDGVSEGQFAQVMDSELKAIYNAFRRMVGPTSNRKVEVLFLLVQKRHHTRLFLGAQNPQNVEPGTVVDSVIVHARELDFYLVSHQAIKGTARPTRYHAVCNDSNIPMSEVEQLTYYLCHLFSRCFRSVSYPTPTYYAHLACMRAKSLTYGDRFNSQDLERNPQRLKVMQRMLESSRMFFV